MKLRRLDCSNTPIGDLTMLSGLMSLTHLDCSETPVEDLRPLRGLKNLLSLDIADTNVQDLTPITRLRKLETLECSNTKITDLRAIAGLLQLKNLFFGNTRINDLAPIAALSNLESLAAWSTLIKHLEPIANHAKLKYLNIWDTRVSDLSPLSALQALESIDCAATPIKDLTPLSELKKLESLDISNTQVQELKPIATCENLEILQAGGTKITDLKALSGLTRLAHLDCSNSRIRNLNPLSGIDLESLRCSNTNVADLTPLKGMKRLSMLDCDGTRIGDLSPIINLSGLTHLCASACQIKFLPEEISNLRSLEVFDARGNKLRALPKQLGFLSKLEEAAQAINSQNRAGLLLEGNPLPPPLPELIAPGQPQATINVLRWLRGEPIETEAKDPNPPAPAESADDPPAIPEQGAGPRVVLDQTGRLVFAKPSDLDAKGNDRNRLEALHPALREAAADLFKALQDHPSNLRNERLLQKADAYRALVDLPLDEVNFARLYGAGMQLLNAASATRRALDAGWVDMPDLTPIQEECLANIENLHPPFVLASRDGQEMLADQSLIQLTSEDVQAIKAAGTVLGNSLLEYDDLAEPAVGQTITDAAAEIGEGVNDKRDAATAVTALRNGLITLTATSVVVCLPILGTWVIGGVVGTAAGGLAALTLNEAVKKTKAFQVTTGLMAQGFESFTERQFAEFTGRLKRHREQLLKQEPQLRRIAHIWGFTWLGASLDWLKRNSPPDKKE